MWSASITVLVLLSAAGCRAELPKSTPQCSKDWGGWWDAYNCGTYPLHWSVASGNMELTKQLLDAGEDINKRDERLWTPIIEAAFFGKQFIAVELIRRGADLRAQGYMGLNVVKVAKLKWCVGHSQVNTCPTTLYDYDRAIEVLVRGCAWTECVEGFRCVGRQCWEDKCHNVECAENAACVVENRKPICRCKDGFIGEDPKTNCEKINGGGGKTGLETANLVLNPCPDYYYLFNNQCLYIDDMKAVSWHDAVKLCKKREGVLANIEDPQNFTSYMEEFYPKMSFWLGANDRKKEGVWRWQSGELLADEFPWGTNQHGKQQPNNGRDREHCMTLKHFNEELGKQYVDNKCGLKHHYVCAAPRNYVDDVSPESNSVYSSIENNSSISDDNQSNTSAKYTVSSNLQENNNNESDSSSSSSSSGGGNSESNADSNTVTSDIDQEDSNSGSGDSDISSSESGNNNNNNNNSNLTDETNNQRNKRSDAEYDDSIQYRSGRFYKIYH